MFLPPTLTRPRKGRGIAYGRNLRARSCPELHAPNEHNRSSCFDSGLFAIRFQGVAAAAERRVPPSLGSDSGFSICDSPAIKGAGEKCRGRDDAIGPNLGDDFTF